MLAILCPVNKPFEQYNCVNIPDVISYLMLEWDRLESRRALALNPCVHCIDGYCDDRVNIQKKYNPWGVQNKSE